MTIELICPPICKINYLPLAMRKLKKVKFLHYMKIFAIVVAAAMSGNKDYKSATSIYDFTANSIKGEEVPLSK